MKAPSAVSIADMPAANRIGSESTARNGTWWVATPAEIASSPTSLAVSNPSPKRIPSGYMCQLGRIRRDEAPEEEPVHEAAVEQPLLEPLARRSSPRPHVEEDPEDVDEDDQVEDADDPQERPRHARADVAAVVLERRDGGAGGLGADREAGGEREHDRRVPEREEEPDAQRIACPPGAACASCCRWPRCGRRRRRGAGRTCRPARPSPASVGFRASSRGTGPSRADGARRRPRRTRPGEAARIG